MAVLFDGLAYGMLLFLMSAGLSITMGLMNFVNLAHGVFAMMGGYLALFISKHSQLSFVPILPLVFINCFIVGLVLERLLFRRFYERSALDQVLFSIGLVFVFVAAATFVFGPSVHTLQLPSYFKGQVYFFNFGLGRYRLFLIAFGLSIAVLMWWVVSSTRFGAMIRASVNNSSVASGMGINVNRLFVLTFAIGSGLAGLGGALSLELLSMEPSFPLKYMVYFLLVVSMGGAGTLLGPFVAAIMIGVVDTASKYYMPELGGFMVYLLMVMVLVIRPQGIVRKPGSLSGSTL